MDRNQGNKNDHVQAIAESVCAVGKNLLRTGLVAGTWGNVSQRVDDRRMIITPSGIFYEKLKGADMVLVDILDLSHKAVGTPSEGITGVKPSSESPMHAQIYKERSEIEAIIHFHSLYACAASALKEEIPPYFEDVAQIVGPSIRISRQGLTGSAELAEGVAEALEGRFGTLLANHGAVCAGRDMEEAFAAALVLEKACHVHFLLRRTGCFPLSEEKAVETRNFYLNQYQQK